MSGPESTPPASVATRAKTTRKQIRGSTLLMAGRGISLGLNFVVQVLIVRYLSKLDFGAFAYGLQTMHLVSRVALFGMDRAAARFIAIHDEQRDPPRLLGSIAVMVTTILCLGCGAILVVLGFRGFIGSRITTNPESLAMLLALIALAPVEAMDALLQATFAAFAKARLIFVRRHVVGPSLKIVAVLIVVLAKGNVYQLAFAYVVAGIFGFIIGAWLLVHVLRARGLLEQFRVSSLVFSPRKLYAFGLPMMLSDLTQQLRSTLVVILLEFFHGTVGVADFRAVRPLARLNSVVLISFGQMFMPLVARLFVRNESRQINDVFWRSTAWVTVLSFPLFALSFVFARPVTVLLFGKQYTDSSTILALLSLGIFLSATVGLNSLVLKGAGKTRLVVVTDSITVVFMVALNLIVIPRWGALGGAYANCGTALFQAVLYQVFTHRATGIDLFPRLYVKVYSVIALAIGGLVLVQKLWAPHVVICGILVGLAWVGVLVTSRRRLDVEQTFPELLKLPLARKLLVPRRRKVAG